MRRQIEEFGNLYTTRAVFDFVVAVIAGVVKASSPAAGSSRSKVRPYTVDSRSFVWVGEESLAEQSQNDKPHWEAIPAASVDIHAPSHLKHRGIPRALRFGTLPSGVTRCARPALPTVYGVLTIAGPSVVVASTVPYSAEALNLGGSRPTGWWKWLTCMCDACQTHSGTDTCGFFGQGAVYVPPPWIEFKAGTTPAGAWLITWLEDQFVEGVAPDVDQLAAGLVGFGKYIKVHAPARTYVKSCHAKWLEKQKKARQQADKRREEEEKKNN